MGKARTLFNGGAAQTLIGRVTPTAEQREFLQDHWNKLAEHLKSELRAKYGYNVSTWLQGSYKYATLIKPVHMQEEYDVDVGVYFEWGDEQNAEPSPRQLREWVQEELLVYQRTCSELRSVEAPPKQRCSRASYIRQFHIDTPVYHLHSEKESRRLACWSNDWENSDPKLLYKWFRDAVTGDDREQLRRLIRYLKAWAAVSFDDIPESRPSSILLTVLVTEAYQNLGFQRLFGIDDDDALIAVIKAIHERLIGDHRVPNPVDRHEDLNRMSNDSWDGFVPQLDVLLDIARRASDATDEAAAALIWSEAFSFLMPLPEATQVEVVDQDSGRALMQLPDIDIEVYARNPKRLIARHRNVVPGVAKDCDLVFTIANPHVVPQFATIEWTVRNQGEDADWRSDLGHRRIGMRMLSTNEHTTYIGTHHMDCIVRFNGQTIAVRRIPVTVHDVRHKAVNPPQPAYTKLRSFLRRR
ncbi:MAG TPA: CBASS cGAMP synthase [Noviherbaspirillum sp.]|nr:CBASS cGAMP synthase [Noviherbaspirillum sp.]